MTHYLSFRGKRNNFDRNTQTITATKKQHIYIHVLISFPPNIEHEKKDSTHFLCPTLWKTNLKFDTFWSVIFKIWQIYKTRGEWNRKLFFVLFKHFKSSLLLLLHLLCTTFIVSDSFEISPKYCCCCCYPCRISQPYNSLWWCCFTQIYLSKQWFLNF